MSYMTASIDELVKVGEGMVEAERIASEREMQAEAERHEGLIKQFMEHVRDELPGALHEYLSWVEVKFLKAYGAEFRAQLVMDDFCTIILGSVTELDSSRSAIEAFGDLKYYLWVPRVEADWDGDQFYTVRHDMRFVERGLAAALYDAKMIGNHEQEVREQCAEQNAKREIDAAIAADKSAVVRCRFDDLEILIGEARFDAEVDLDSSMKLRLMLDIARSLDGILGVLKGRSDGGV